MGSRHGNNTVDRQKEVRLRSSRARVAAAASAALHLPRPVFSVLSLTYTQSERR